MSYASRSVYPHIRERSSEDDHLSLIEMNNINEESIEMLLIIKKSLLSDANVWRDYLYVSHIFWEGIQFYLCENLFHSLL